MANHKIDLTLIASKPPKHTSGKKTMNVHIDFVGNFQDVHVQKCFHEIKSTIGMDVTELGTETVPWFPTKIQDFDFIGKRILSEGDGIQAADHPGFRDLDYKARRKMITDVALDYKIG
jgi:phenylalanine-4-hydroxylase